MARKKRLLSGVRLGLAIVVTLVMAFPIYWMINTALKPSSELLLSIPTFWPGSICWENFTSAWEKVPLLRYFWNTIVVTFWSLLFTTIVGLPAAYAFARGRFPGRDILFYIVMGAMMVPGQVTFIPLYIMCARLGWVNTYIGLILPNMVSAHFIFMMRQAFMTVDQSYVDAGRMDGLGPIGMIWHIMAPMCKPTLITMLLINFIGSWNDYFWPKIITKGDEYRMIAAGIVKLYDSFGSNEILENTNIVMAGALISLAPVVILFVIFQKYMVQGYAKAAMK